MTNVLARSILFLLVVLGSSGAGCSDTRRSGDGGTGLMDPDAGGAQSADLARAADLAHPMGFVDDGTPARPACTSSFGNALSLAHGRLDGFLVAIVPPTQQGCSSDAHHVHLQVKMKGAVYDIAVNMQDMNNADVLYAERDLPLPGGAWAEGWHPGDILDYPALGAHASDFTPMVESALVLKVQGELQAVNHISVFATGYGAAGAHDVHRKGGGLDGAILTQPLSANAHALLFHFANQSF